MTILSTTLNQVLQDWSLWPILNAFEISACEFTPLEQGLTNENWLVTLPSIPNRQSFVIRINAKNAESLNIHHKSEFEIVGNISALKLCPPILYKEPNFKYWVRPYIVGDTLAEIQAKKNSVIDDLVNVASILKQAHSQPIKAHWPSVNTMERTEYFWQQITPKLTIHSFKVLNLKQQLDQLLKTESSQVSLCHMDPNIHNWIKDQAGKLHLIDWEYAGLGDPIWDLAVFSESAKLNKSQEQQLLTYYNKYSLSQLQHAKFQMKYLSILWFAVQESTHNDILLCELENLFHQILKTHNI